MKSAILCSTGEIDSMEKKYIVLSHHILEKCIEIDRHKVDVIHKLLRLISEFLGHTRFYSSFIKDFFQISHPWCKHEKESKFYFYYVFLREFENLKENLTSPPIIISSEWGKPFEKMCDASGIEFGVVFGERRVKIFFLYII